MLMESPRLPTRPSTLILSWRNFSNADRSKILSLTGWVQLMMYCKGSHVSNQIDWRSWLKQAISWEGEMGIAKHPNTYLLGHLGRLAFLCFLRITIFLAYCSSSPSPHKAGGEQQSGHVHTGTGAILNERCRSQRS